MGVSRWLCEQQSCREDGGWATHHEDRGPDSWVTESKAERSTPLERAEDSQAGSHVVTV